LNVARAEADLNSLIERRVREREAADVVEDLWEAGVKKDGERRRRRLRAEWFVYFSTLADSLRASADGFEAKAQALLEDDERSTR